jgi:squalene-hopene/tetraprenyl-beta-curcumene cyclase
MNSGWLVPRRFRFDSPHSGPSGESSLAPDSDFADPQVAERFAEAIARTRDYLLGQQAPEGYWVGELEGDTILESEYILLLAFLGRESSERAHQAARYLLQQQMPEGGWANYPGGPLEISASVKAYWALKITGHEPDEEYMVRACRAIREAGGAERVNSFTRYYMALLGVISYHQCPAVPPEMILLPSWSPINIYEMSAWSRTIVIPLSLLWAFRPVRRMPAECGIEELFLRSAAELPVTMGPAENVDRLTRPRWFNWDRFFRGLDRCIKLCENCGIRPFRKLAIRRAAAWMQERFAHSDGLGAIFPPIVWSVIGLKCLGHTDDSPDVQRALDELEKLVIETDDTVRLQPCKSPVWDTAITTLALREAGVSSGHSAIRRAVGWLLAKEVRHPGDWSVRNRGVEPSGWFFEFENRFYPDVDDTIMVVMALNRCLPNNDPSEWQADFLWGEDRTAGGDQISTVLSKRSTSEELAVAEIEAMRPTLTAIRRGVQWITSMQNRDGGWGAFDVNNDREILTRVPFADHNAMIDPSTADITARVLEMFGRLGAGHRNPAISLAINFVWSHQEPDYCWQGRWGVNYIYGTWQVLVGLQAIGVPATDSRMQKAAAWLKQTQRLGGGWGETPRSYDEPHLRGQGEPTPSQTAWALMGLCAAGEADSEAVDRGVQYLFDTQLPDGTWEEEPFTGTGFPRVFYLRYHMYRIYFPLMALARIARLRGVPLASPAE